MEDKLFELLREEKNPETKIEKAADIKYKFSELSSKSITFKPDFFTFKVDDQVQKIIFFGKYSTTNGNLIFVCEIPIKTKDFWLEELNEILKTISIND